MTGNSEARTNETRKTETGTAGAPDQELAAKLSSGIRIEKGNPTDQDLAAIVAVLASIGGGEPERGPRSLWGVHKERSRPLYFQGPNAYTSLTPTFWTSGK